MPKLVLPYVLRAPDRPFAGTIPPGTPRTPRKVHDTPVPHPLMTVESASKNTGTTRRDRLAGKVRATPGRCPLPMPGEGAQHPVPPGLKDLQLLGLRLVTAGVWCGVPVSLAARSGRGEDHRPRLHRHPGGSAQPRLGSVQRGSRPGPTRTWPPQPVLERCIRDHTGCHQGGCPAGAANRGPSGDRRGHCPTAASPASAGVRATHSVQVSHQGQGVVTVVETPHEIVVSVL